MRKQNIETTLTRVDVVHERQTKRCSSRVRPGDRFCELNFRQFKLAVGFCGPVPGSHSYRVLRSMDARLSLM